MKRTSATAIVLALLVLLAGCGYTPRPGDANQLAVRGTPSGYEFIFEPCPGFTLIGLGVLELKAPNRSWDVEMPTLAGPAGGDVRTIAMFQAPAGWSMTHSSLTQLETGTAYTARAASGVGGAISVLPDFAIEQLNKLRDGEVLARASQNSSDAMSMVDFKKRATQIC